MSKSTKKSVLAVLCGLLALYILGVVFIPRSSYDNAFTQHFVSVYNAVQGDVFFILFMLVLTGGLYYFMIYKPKHPKKGKSRDVSTARKVLFYAALVYIALLVIIPYITLPGTAAAWLVTFFDHFIMIKDVIMSDYALLTVLLLVLGAAYYFMVYKPKV